MISGHAEYRSLVVAAMFVSLVSLIMSFMVVVWNVGDVPKDDFDNLEEIAARLDDLEEEHDYL